MIANSAAYPKRAASSRRSCAACALPSTFWPAKSLKACSAMMATAANAILVASSMRLSLRVMSSFWAPVAIRWTIPRGLERLAATYAGLPSTSWLSWPAPSFVPISHPPPPEMPTLAGSDVAASAPYALAMPPPALGTANAPWPVLSACTLPNV